ncbi:AraC-like DNA-binding protein [Chryseobacterium ginsenosidimutans]|uniref:helix-turn-helix domain-containing protein n=1 Tax=Chryseobacterium ginsenosidimutans TaxID=687846 RepID=UPI002787CCDB|nr:AraC family transcriptional regulator [Chryseobacterium ginsenosidimutans]MDQ0595202.1 AraC-like DNA-binding protein [Chryseobacterium ginsenosidimutans]
MEISGAFLAVILEAILSFFLIKKEDSKKNIFLILYIVTVTLDFLCEYFLFSFGNRNTFLIDQYPTSFRLLKGPLLFLVGRHLLNRNNTWKQYLHFLPFFVVFIFNIIVLFIGTESQRFHQFYLWIFKVYPFYWAGYLIVTIVGQVRGRSSGNKFQKLFVQFLCFVLASVTGYLICGYGRLIDGEVLRMIYTFSFFVQFVFLIRLTQVDNQPLKTDGFNSTNVNEAPVTKESQRKNTKYRTSVLSQDYVTNTNNRLIELLKNKKIYTKEDLSLDDVSNMIHISKNHLSQCISEGLHTTFYDLINKYRIEAFIEQINQNPELQISELYFHCGFRSKATFYKYFKQETGVNPNDYRKKILKEKELQQLN